MSDVTIVIPAMITLGTIMVLGFIGNYIFNRTQIPSIVWLLLFGLVVGFIFNTQIEQLGENLLRTISGFFAAVAIVIILFDGGINIDLHQLFKGAPRGLLLTVTGFCLSLLATMVIIILLSISGILPLTPRESVIIGVVLGAIVGGTSSPIVIPLASKLKNLQDKTKMILSIESILTDPLSIVVFLAAFVMITSGASIGEGIKSLVSTFSVGAVLGAALGLVWLPIMHKIRKEQFSYILTLAIVFLVYCLTESFWGGAGALSCLMFGLVLGNGKKILKMMKYSGRKFEMDEETKQFHSLTSFVIRTFFFVYLGMMVSFQKIEFIIVGILILLALLGLRYLTVQIATFRGGFEKDDKQTMNVMMPRGLAAAILALTFGPRLIGEEGLNLGPTMEGFFQDAAFVVILGTAIVCTIGVSIISHYEMKKLQNNTKQPENAKTDEIVNNEEK
jgi:cell volume regulation protein A